MTTSRRKLLQTAVAAAPVVALAGLSGTASAGPNGTRPTILTNLSVVALSATQMRVTGRLSLLSGAGLAGMKIDIFAVREASFTRWSTVYTDNAGNFLYTGAKVPVGSKVQIVVDGNGANSQPFPTFGRP